MAVLGLRDTDEGDWDKVRVMQQNGIAEHLRNRLLLNIISAAFIIAAAWGQNNLYYLAGWGVVLLGSLYYILRDFEVIDLNGRFAKSRERMKKTALSGIAQGLIWSAPVLLFVGTEPSWSFLTVWTAMGLLMAGSALLLYAMPLATVIFISVICLAGIAKFVLAGQLLMAGAIATYGITIGAACVANAKSYLQFRFSEEGSDEQGEVVSLLLREFEESSADWLWQLNSSRRVVHASSRLAAALGREPEDIEGRALVELFAGDAWETGNLPSSLHDLAEKLKRRESFSNMIVRVSINGTGRWWELSASPKLDENGAFLGFRGVASDVTEKRESSEKIAHMARFDTLTGLPNRLQVNEALAKSLENAQQWRGRCGFMMIDLDRFKSVNDTLGHLVGDRLLAHVSQRLTSLMSDNELCGRLGGDEFAVVVRDASDRSYVERLANKIIESLSRPYLVDQHKLYIGASIGTATGPRDGQTVEMLMRNSDLALYRSKDGGGGQAKAYEPRLHVYAEERRVMEIALRDALDNKEFSLNYQPVVSAGTDGVVGFEALLRWHNPHFGHVSPAKFIPIAEEARLIYQIGEWVLQQACQEAMKWPGSVKVAVNVSADQLTNPSFITSVVSALQDSGLAPQRLEIEVTESIFLHEGTGAVDTLEEILALGIGLSLDDFGTGYSSLGYLRKTRFSTIKVDRSFVQGAAKNVAESLAIIRAVVAMADSLGMQTTAEGAETQEEVDMIKSLGCTKIQGYFYGRPMLAEDAAKLFAFPQLHAEMPRLSPECVKREAS